jgi:hypothetical protein
MNIINKCKLFFKKEQNLDLIRTREITYNIEMVPFKYDDYVVINNPNKDSIILNIFKFKNKVFLQIRESHIPIPRSIWSNIPKSSCKFSSFCKEKYYIDEPSNTCFITQDVNTDLRNVKKIWITHNIDRIQFNDEEFFIIKKNHKLVHIFKFKDDIFTHIDEYQSNWSKVSNLNIEVNIITSYITREVMLISEDDIIQCLSDTLYYYKILQYNILLRQGG